MKVTHEYFHKYNTRKIDFRQPTGLFMINGDAVPRDKLDEESQIKKKSAYRAEDLMGSSQLVYSPGHGNISPLRRHLREYPQVNLRYNAEHEDKFEFSNGRATTASTNRSRHSHTSSVSPSRIVLKEEDLLASQRAGTPLYELLGVQRVVTPKHYFNRLKTPNYEILEDHAKSIHTARALFHTHIYHDNNHSQIFKEHQTVNNAERLWNARENRIKSLRNSWTSVRETPVPNNQKTLGLTPLRAIGWGQDKPHHIPVDRNVRRLHTKLDAPVTGRGNVWALEKG